LRIHVSFILYRN